MFKHVPKELYGSGNPIDVTLHEMDRFGVEIGLISCENEVGQTALKQHPERFVASAEVDPNSGMDGLRRMVARYEEFGVRAAIPRSTSTTPASIPSTPSAASSTCRSSCARVCRVRACRCRARRSSGSTG